MIVPKKYLREIFRVELPLEISSKVEKFLFLAKETLFPLPN